IAIFLENGFSIPPAGSTRSMEPVETYLNVSQGDAGILCSTPSGQWSYPLDGSETRKRAGEESRSSIANWEGAALRIETEVSGPQNYRVVDRWLLSSDRNTLTIQRQVSRADSQGEGVLIFRREGTGVPDSRAPSGVSLTPPQAAQADTPP